MEEIKIKIIEFDDTVVNFDIIGRGNVLLDYENGYFDSSSFDDYEFSEDLFYDFVLENIDELIYIVLKPSYQKIKSDLRKLVGVNFDDISDSFNDIDRVILLEWISDSLPILIKHEDYEICGDLEKLKQHIIKV
jgi:hypothetical protein